MSTEFEVDQLRVAVAQAEATAKLAQAVTDLSTVALRLHDALLIAVTKLAEPDIDESPGVETRRNE